MRARILATGRRRLASLFTEPPRSYSYNRIAKLGRRKVPIQRHPVSYHGHLATVASELARLGFGYSGEGERRFRWEAERHSARRQKLFAFPPESAFTFRPECCSESQRNRVRLQTGIAFTFDRIPHVDGETPRKSYCGKRRINRCKREIRRYKSSV